MYAKTLRVRDLAVQLAEELGLDEHLPTVKRAAELAEADLATDMVL